VDQQQKTVWGSAMVCGLASATVGAVYAAWSVWSSGFEPDFPAHAQTTTDNLPFFAGVGALLFGVPGVALGFMIGLVLIRLTSRRKADKPSG
jgi:hypothetical protein